MVKVSTDGGLQELTDEILACPDDPELYFARGKFYYRAGDNARAMNDFLKVLELSPGQAEASEYVEMLREIFEFRNLDMYNP